MCVVCSSSVCEIKVEYVSFGGRPADLVLNFLTSFSAIKLLQFLPVLWTKILEVCKSMFFLSFVQTLLLCFRR